MAQILETPLPEDFYKEEGWFNNLTSFYGEQKKKLPVDALRAPMKLLTHAVYDVSYIYGNFPEIVYNALGQTIDPLFEPDEYHDEIYSVLKKAGEDENRPLLIEYAEGLLTIRRLFERNKKLYNEKFAAEIELTPGAGDASKYEKFSSEIQNITKIHVNQVRRMVFDRK